MKPDKTQISITCYRVMIVSQKMKLVIKLWSILSKILPVASLHAACVSFQTEEK
jgi:hypothetical protein